LFKHKIGGLIHTSSSCSGSKILLHFAKIKLFRLFSHIYSGCPKIVWSQKPKKVKRQKTVSFSIYLLSGGGSGATY